MSGKGDTPRPLSVSPATYAENYARIRWTESHEQAEPEGYDPREKLCPPLEDPRETLRQRHLAEAREVVLGQSCADWPPSQSLPHITPEDCPCP